MFLTDSSCMETKSTKQTFNGYTNWQTWNLVNWALDEQSETSISFDDFKRHFMDEYYEAHAVVQSQIDLNEINWDEIKKAMEG